MSKKKKNKNHKPFNPFVFEFVPDDQIDFHYFGPLIPYDIEKILFEFLEDSYVAGHKNLLVVTGKGAVVRPNVERLLKQNKFVESFRQAGYFNGQDGAFEITLKSKY